MLLQVAEVDVTFIRDLKFVFAPVSSSFLLMRCCIELLNVRISSLMPLLLSMTRTLSDGTGLELAVGPRVRHGPP